MPDAVPGRDHDTLFYHVRPGDSLGAIIRRYHGPVSPGQ